MNCKNCGAEIKEGAFFCGNCGMKVEAEQPVYQEPVQPAYEEPVQGEYHQETYNEYQEQGSYQAPAYQPEYNAEPVYGGEKPNTILWIVLAAVEIFTCCQLTGIISLIFAILGHVAAEKGDYVEAERKTKTAKIWFWVGLALGIIFVLAYFVLVAVGLAAGITEEFLYY